MSSYDEIPDELIEYVEVKGTRYFVKKATGKGSTTFGIFKSLKEACAAAYILQKNNWKINNIGFDRVANFAGEFFVFKVEENKLVFDDKFDDYEEAVEYIEINSGSNDGHNDIFHNSLKKNGHKERWKFSQKDEDSTVEDKCIFEEKGKFIVKKSKRHWKIFGEFNSYEEASAAKKLLVDSRWNVKNEHELVFHNNFYWVFDVDDGMLTFKGKSQSYEDALDLFDAEIPQKEPETPFLKDMDDTIKKSSKKPKSKSKKTTRKKPNKKKIVRNKKSQNMTYNDMVNKYVLTKTSVDIEKVLNPKIKDHELENESIMIFVERYGDNADDLSSILEFTFSAGNQIKCVVDGVEIDWNNRNNIRLPYFPEFQLIIDILVANEWNLSRISNSSSIYFYKDSFYKVQVSKGNIVFGKFVSYEVAENTLMIFEDPTNPEELGIERYGDYYHLICPQKSGIYKTLPLKSLEETKAIRDILIHADGDFSIFDKYDLFYLNGIYWELVSNNNIITLIGRYELIKTL